MSQLNNKNTLMQRQHDKVNAISFSQFMSADVVKRKINDVIGGENGQKFITSIVSAVTNNIELSKCSNDSIFSAALLGESLNLSPSPQLGHYYLVPFNETIKNSDGTKTIKKVAQFQLGYKGYIQLAIRSGEYKKLNVLEIKDGELIKYDPLNEEIEVQLIQSDTERERAKTVGYYAMFEYINGFKKAIYWSFEKMQAHAKEYSQAYRSDLTKKTTYSFWSKDFDSMALKTMIRQLISKWGIMSIDFQKAYENDMAYIKEDGKPEYIDNINDVQDTELSDIPEAAYQERTVETNIEINSETGEVIEETVPEIKEKIEVVDIDEL